MQAVTPISAVIAKPSFQQQTKSAVLESGNVPATFRHSGLYLNHIIEQGVRILALEENRAFLIDGYRLPIYQQLAAYFTGDYSLFGQQLNPNKGLLIFGGFGVGKSLMMRLFRENAIQSYRVISSREIASQYRESGTFAKYKAPFWNNYSHCHFGQRTIGLCIDDAGAETIASHFGNALNVIAEILQDRYDKPELRGPMTHIITNATTVELKDAYGPRVYNRLQQLFNVVTFDEEATSLRE
ncbi:hypothetical protein [Fibrella forsythiae]|uniref:ATPase n=1 Tax=Fibrella forsythiae TaxID=2817061 RepID=A0ABS3JLH7_9BACT|nr:hypothetical protein [Fibrella forsythiae]MBO0950857.1 hypothetical protein [Fibrella forsythiae]